MMADDLNMRWTLLMVSIPPFRIQIKQWPRRAAGITGLTALMSLAVHIAALGYVGADAGPTSMHHEAWLLHRDQPTQPALIGSVDLPQPLSLQVARAARVGRRQRGDQRHRGGLPRAVLRLVGPTWVDFLKKSASFSFARA